MWIILVIAILAAAFFSATFIAYRMTFAVLPKHKAGDETLPNTSQYAPLLQKITSLVETVKAIPCEDVTITSSDGLKLHGRYYETEPGAPVSILFHGYRSTAFHDFSGGLQLTLKCGCNALLVDQRAHGQSEGHCLSFGIRESDDCVKWVNYAIDRFGPQTPIFLTGISMGAATVLMASDKDLPSNVIGIISDCGYSSPRDIIRKVTQDMKYPLGPTYFLVRMAGLIYGGFDIESHSAPQALAKTNIPVLFIHGEDDRFVPCAMTVKNYEACAGEKQLLTVPEAGHGLSYMVAPKAYHEAVEGFLRIQHQRYRG